MSEKTAKKETKKLGTTMAIVETGGKQYIVHEGTTITVESIFGVEEGGTVTFDKVLLVDDGTTQKVGTPYLSGVKVTGKVAVEGRAKKVVVIRYRQKSRYFKKNGHRQPFMKVIVEKVA